MEQITIVIQIISWNMNGVNNTMRGTIKSYGVNVKWNVNQIPVVPGGTCETSWENWSI